MDDQPKGKKDHVDEEEWDAARELGNPIRRFLDCGPIIARLFVYVTSGRMAQAFHRGAVPATHRAEQIHRGLGPDMKKFFEIPALKAERR
jgi:hypothetical protein